jgi:hypothetical protein
VSGGGRGAGLWWLAKGLEGAGLVVVLMGVVWSIVLGLQDEGMASMRYEFQALMVGGALFLLGYLLERRLGAR